MTTMINRDSNREDTGERLTNLVKGKTIERVSIADGMNDFFVIHFTDGTILNLEYDWIYEWGFVAPSQPAPRPDAEEAGT